MSSLHLKPQVPYHRVSIVLNVARFKPWLRFIFIFQFSVFMLHCGLDVEDPTPPSPPVWTQKSLPEEWPERGIDANELGEIHLEWELNPTEQSIVSYKIFRAEYSEYTGSYTEYILIKTISIIPNKINEYDDNNVTPETKYSYKIKAEDISANESAFSDSVAYTLLPSINLAAMTPNGFTIELGANRKLFWSHRATIVVEDYCLTILDEENSLIVRTVITPGNYTGQTESWAIPTSIELVPGKVYRWRVDMGAQYEAGYESVGSESNWAVFLYGGL